MNLIGTDEIFANRSKMPRENNTLEIPDPLKKPKCEENFETIEKIYEKMQDNYTKNGQSQQTMLFLRSISNNKIVPIEYRNLPLLRMLHETCKELLMNELEITLWKIYLESVVWHDKSRSLQVLFLYSSFAAKMLMNSEHDINPIKTCISNKYPGFFKGYENWYQFNAEELRVPIRDFNFQFNLYRKPNFFEVIDYNFYVDELLQIAPPGVFEKEPKIDFAGEIEDFKQPELMNLNSVLENNEFPVLTFSRTVSIDVFKELELDPLHEYT